MAAKQKTPSLAKTIAISLLSIGVILIVVSIFYSSANSSVYSIVGLGLTFWGVILLYITPSPHVPLQLLNAVAAPATSNLERILKESGISEKGIYLPPKRLSDFESSLVFIPAKGEKGLPTPDQQGKSSLYIKEPLGLLITPPGISLVKLLEKEFGMSFTRTDRKALEDKLPKLLVENLEIATRVEISSKEEKVNVKLEDTILSELYQETQKLEGIVDAVGSVLGSTIACAFAKSTGKPIKITQENFEGNGKTLNIELVIMED